MKPLGINKVKSIFLLIVFLLPLFVQNVAVFSVFDSDSEDITMLKEEEVEARADAVDSSNRINLLSNPTLNNIQSGQNRIIPNWRVSSSSVPIQVTTNVSLLSESIGSNLRTSDAAIQWRHEFLLFGNIDFFLKSERKVILSQTVITAPQRDYQFGAQVRGDRRHDNYMELRAYRGTAISGPGEIAFNNDTDIHLRPTLILDFSAPTEETTISIRASTESPIELAPELFTFGDTFMFEHANDVRIEHRTPSGEDLTDPITLKGFMGDTYTSTERTFEGYTLVESPGNAAGDFTREDQTVVYVYKRLPDSITVTPEKSIISVGETEQLRATLTPNTDQLDDSSVSWSSSNESVATVDSNGLVTGLSLGQVDITGETINGLTATAKVIVENFTFTFSGTEGNSEATVTGYLGTDREVIIPSEAVNHEAGWTTPSPVTRVGSSRFTLNGEIESLFLPDSIIEVGSNAFENRAELTSVRWGKSIQTIEASAFQGTSIRELVLPDSVTRIGASAFFQGNIETLELGNNLEEIGIRSFGENKLTSVRIPDSVQIIGTNGFFNNQLTDIHLGKGLTSIRQGVFSSNNLTSIEIPETIISVGTEAFRYNRLTKVEIPETVQTLGQFAFGSNPLEEVVFLGEVEQIGEHSFESTPLKRIVVPEENLSNYHALLTSEVLEGVTERTYLSVPESNYSVGTQIENTIDAGDSLSFEVVSRNRYQLGDLERFQWVLATPNVAWYKDTQVLSGESNSVFQLVDAQEKDNGIYHALVDGDELEGLSVTVIPSIHPPLPPVDPSDPDPEVSENPNEGALAIRYVSSLDFGSTETKNKSQTLLSLPDQDNAENDLPNMVTIQDMRPESQRTGWLLTVSQRGELMNGAQLTMEPYAHESFITRLGLKLPGIPVVLNSGAQNFAIADGTGEAGIVSFGMHQPGSNGVELRIPSGIGIGNYQASLDWSLVTGP